MGTVDQLLTMTDYVLLTCLIGFTIFVPCLSAPDKRSATPTCGQRSVLTDNGASELSGASSRIVGGQESVTNSWPSLCNFQDREGYHICGSTLVKNNKGDFYLITAAHCITQRRASRYTASCGTHSFERGNPHMQTFTFRAMKMHENYDDVTFDNDIAIFEFNNQPVENDYVRAACIADTDHTDMEPAIVAGWGTTKFEGDMALNLQQVNKPIKPDKTCRDLLGSEFNSANMLCAGEIAGGVDACQGDSGGPLYTLRNGLWTLTGVVSWGYGCAAPRSPGVYADVFQLRSWISSNINK